MILWLILNARIHSGDLMVTLDLWSVYSLSRWVHTLRPHLSLILNRMIFLEGIILGVSVIISFMSIEVLVSTSVSPLMTCIKSAHWAHCMYRAPLIEFSFLLSALSISLSYILCISILCVYLIVVVSDNRLCILCFA